MARDRITLHDQLEKSILNNSVVISDATNEAIYVPLDTVNYFTVGADIDVKNHAFINDLEGASKPGVYNTPSTPPANPALNATLLDVFDDFFIYWKWDGATWNKVTEENRLVYVQLSYYAVGVIASQTNYVVPPTLNGFRLRSVTCYNNSAGTITASQVILKNNVLAGPNITIAANAGVNFNDFVTTFASLDEIAVAVASLPAAPCLFSITLTLQKP